MRGPIGMEFGFTVQGYVPGYLRENDPDAEHRVLLEDLETCIAADQAGFKYVWVSEHHFLDEYSHISANDVFLGALASRTTRVHLGSGIFNPLPKVHHPATIAERSAMLDQLTSGRFELGTGRGSGSTEVTAFHTELPDASGTRPIWEETIREIPKMWTQEVYEGFKGEYWEMPARPVLPKPYGKPHPPLWYAAGNQSSYEATARMGLGLLGFSLADLSHAERGVKIYKDHIGGAEPIGSYVNDNCLVATFTSYVSEDRKKARRDFLASRPHYIAAQAFRYHDQIPLPPGTPRWPEVPAEIDEPTMDAMIDMGAAFCGDPDEVLAQVRRWESTGADQVLLSRGTKSLQQTLETIRLFGEHIIPKLDKDPVHRSDRNRRAGG